MVLAVVVAQTTTVPVRIVNRSGPSTVEIVGVVVTFLAVLVALFGQQFHAWRRQPRLTLTPDPDSYATAVGLGGVPMNLRLHNERGRDTARDVEIFVTVATREIGQQGVPSMTVATDANLNLDDPAAEGPGRATTTVPSGHSRNVNFAVVGVLEDEHGKLTDRWAYLALYPPRFAEASWLVFGVDYAATLVVTGSNFDAITYRGNLAFSETDEDGVRLRSLEWSAPPTRTD